jgi:hypothetical protein
LCVCVWGGRGQREQNIPPGHEIWMYDTTQEKIKGGKIHSQISPSRVFRFRLIACRWREQLQTRPLSVDFPVRDWHACQLPLKSLTHER